MTSQAQRIHDGYHDINMTTSSEMVAFTKRFTSVYVLSRDAESLIFFVGLRLRHSDSNIRKFRTPDSGHKKTWITTLGQNQTPTLTLGLTV